ncbi:hypothetical protein L917_11268 [Phytophthora nicotianae]|uniref:Uncharacterized protein n=1 Tax=Phytophthora nicotianae TaxID=4792 RepID=W2KXL0_PHYNI|nr:hypothetical protein L917_11268 [Phytophthora nicotianae]
MSITKINAALASLDWKQVSRTRRGQIILLCGATETQWKTYVKCDSREFKATQDIRSSQMEWIDGYIYIVELPSPAQDIYSFMFGKYLLSHPVVGSYLHTHGRAFVPNQQIYEPDESFGPTEETGVALPSDFLQWWHWSTLKVEIGILRHWGHSPGQLDWKAQRWASFPGVRYVLCVTLRRDMTSAQYKLYTIEDQGLHLPEQKPISVVFPQTYLKFDSRRLLGLQLSDELPYGFPDPLAVNLYAVLDDARR